MSAPMTRRRAQLEKTGELRPPRPGEWFEVPLFSQKKVSRFAEATPILLDAAQLTDMRAPGGPRVILRPKSGPPTGEET